jgi:hypothetical protein
MQIIPVEQVEGEFYGGYPFRVSWSYGGESEPSKLAIEVVNEKGEYSDPELSLESLVTIAIGGFTFSGYLVGYSLNTTPEQKTLSLEYVDESVRLDRFWVGLKEVHPTGSNIILVGKQYHPCDVNMDSSVDYVEGESRMIDACDPCPFSPPDKYKEICDPRIASVENFDTFYTFSDLLPKVISETGLPCDFSASALYMYKAQHIGNLRSVLSSWCSDLGLSFFWDPTQQKLIFKSRTAFPEDAPKYSTIKNNPLATELNYSENILGTFSQGFIGRYERQGSFQKYPCQKDTWKMLRPITLGDLFLREPSPPGSKYSGDISPRSVAVALSYYSSALRDTFLWFIHYGIATALDAELYAGDDGTQGNDDDDAGGNDDDGGEEATTDDSSETGATRATVRASNSGGGGSGDVKGNTYQAEMRAVDPASFEFSTDGSKCGTVHGFRSQGTASNSPSLLTHYGNMTIKEVYHIGSDDGRKKANFYKCRNNMPKELQSIYMGKDGSFKDPKFYFFVAECSEEGYDEAVTSDRNLASSFLGKYYFNKFRTIITGASEDETECSIQGPSEDGGGGWHKAKEGIQNIDIFKFGHEENSMVASLKNSLAKDIEENIKTEDTRLTSSGLEKSPKDYVANSFILLARSGPKWSPERENADKWYGSLYAWCQQQIPHKYANGDGRPDILYIMYPEAKWNEDIKLFMVKEKEGLTLDVELVTHATEVKGGSKVRVEEDEFGNQFRINEGPWGLMSTDCYKINFDGAMEIFVPPGSFGEELNTYKDECVTCPSYSLLSDELYTPVANSYDGAGYRVFVQCSSEFPRMISKFKHNTIINALDAHKVKRVDYVDYQLSEDNIAIFGDSCTPNRGMVTDYLLDLGSTSEYSYSDKQYNISFKLAGTAPETYSVEGGLSAMNIEVSENGCVTSYTLSTKIIEPPSLSYTEQNLRFQQKAAFGGKMGLMTSTRVRTIRH